MQCTPENAACLLDRSIAKADSEHNGPMSREAERGSPIDLGAYQLEVNTGQLFNTLVTVTIYCSMRGYETGLLRATRWTRWVKVVNVMSAAARRHEVGSARSEGDTMSPGRQ